MEQGTFFRCLLENGAEENGAELFVFPGFSVDLFFYR